MAWRATALQAETTDALAVVAADVRNGLRETVGAEAVIDAETIAVGERVSMIVTLPEGADPENIAKAIDLENLEAWCDERKRVHVGIGPGYATKDVDQVVLCVTKVLHVLLGMHAGPQQPQSALDRWFSRG